MKKIQNKEELLGYLILKIDFFQLDNLFIYDQKISILVSHKAFLS